MLNKRDNALGNETSLGALRFVFVEKNQQMENIALDVDGDADRFACELLCDNYRQALVRRAATGKNIKDEWNPGCDRRKLWQVHGKALRLRVHPHSTRPRCLGKLPDMTYQACDILMEHRSELVGDKLSKLKDAR